MGNSRTFRRRISDQRPLWLTKEMEENLYYRWRELMLVVKRRDALLVAHPKWAGLYADFIERLTEDPWWTNAVALHMDPQPVMMFRVEVGTDDLLIWTGRGQKLLTPTEFLGNVGMGRVNWAAPRREGIRPWSEAKVPEGAQKPVTPDPDEAA